MKDDYLTPFINVYHTYCSKCVMRVLILIIIFLISSLCVSPNLEIFFLVLQRIYFYVASQTCCIFRVSSSEKVFLSVKMFSITLWTKMAGIHRWPRVRGPPRLPNILPLGHKNSQTFFLQEQQEHRLYPHICSFTKSSIGLN